MNNYVLITVNNRDSDLVSDFVTNNTYRLVDGMSVAEFLNFSANSLSNRDRIYAEYTVEQRQEVTSSSQISNSSKVNVGTVLAIPKEFLFKDVLFTQNSNFVTDTTNAKTFVSSKISKYLQPKENLNSISTQNKVTKTISSIFVAVWCRSLNVGEKAFFLNLTPFISSLETNVDANGGNFSISLNGFNGIYREGWKPDPVSLKRSIYLGTQSLSNLQLFTEDKGNFILRNEYLSKVISANDLVYIRFNSIEKNRDKLFLSPNDFVGEGEFDMIGFVDSISEGVEPQNHSINLQGRDLIKLLIEDGAYFFPFEFSRGVYFGSRTDEESSTVQRNVISNSVDAFAGFVDRNILTSIQFIFAQLSRIGVIPDNVFNAYPKEERSQYIQSDGSLKDGNGAWKIFKLLIDETVEDRFLVDSSINKEQGSILNAIRKVCQEPFVEIVSDTYDNQFVFMVRKPPFDQVGYRSLVQGDVKVDSEGSILGVNNGVVIDIESQDVLSMNLTFNDQEAYSWYHLTPKGTFFGQGSDMTWALVPAIYFEEYAEVWGNRAYQQVTNYINYRGDVDSTERDKTNNFLSQLFYDLKYIIDIHSYLPFTRRGTITITGDRRIKRGMTVRFHPTGEVFYVDSVNHSYSIGSNVNRVTSVNVSRGMVEKYLEGRVVDGIEEVVSYFDIIQTSLNENAFENSANERAYDTFQRVLSNFRVNRDVFDFFLERRQFA